MAKTGSLLAATFAALCLCSPAHALSSRAWVSGHGTDAAGCGAPTSPCRTFQYVHDNIVAAGGEIDVLDPAGYGSVTINKALSIVNDGVGTAGVQAGAGQNAITFNGGPNDNLLLRGLTIEGLNTAANGVQFNSGLSIAIGNSTIAGFTQNGINLASNSGGFSVVILDNSVVAPNAGPAILAKPTAGTNGQVFVNNSHLGGSNASIVMLDGSGGAASIKMTISYSQVHSTPGTAIVANGPSSGGPVKAVINNSTLTFANAVAEADGSNASISFNADTIVHNGTVATTTNGGVVASYGNNAIEDNAALGPLTTTSLQ